MPRHYLRSSASIGGSISLRGDLRRLEPIVLRPEFCYWMANEANQWTQYAVGDRRWHPADRTRIRRAGMSIPARLRPVLFGLALIALVGVVIATETHMWNRIDQMRDAPETVTKASVESLHQAQTWSSIVLFVVGGVLAVLIYRGLVAPLQTRLRESQRVIERQEKLSSLGVLAAGVAHEIRNPLTSIKVRLFTQQQLLQKGSEEFDDNVFLAGEISRLEKIVKDFLAFARPSDPELAVVRLTDPLRQLRPLLEPSLRQQGIVLREEYLADPMIRVDLAQLKQVLINLIKNAGEAMTEPGTITLRTRTEPAGKGVRGRARAVLEVADTGPGIPPAVARRLFDPFFTTKPSGTGLGLSIAARIVEKHGGTLGYSTELNRGTTFRILLPIELIPHHDTAENPGH